MAIGTRQAKGPTQLLHVEALLRMSFRGRALSNVSHRLCDSASDIFRAPGAAEIGSTRPLAEHSLYSLNDGGGGIRVP